ncbi:adenylate kinase [uncultured Vibrio sp.]|mgnify:CR=1 FL=1|uniref:adenylate kinase n=1 Tax=uncultured Vibrio sp. TaxID=114054 RepID=UPI0025F5759D|nr:adenylate kinase [uncultured Vibrio sp.]
MKKVAVFGKPGSGKSTISKALASVTKIPLHQLDSMLYKANGDAVEKETFNAAHRDVLSNDRWIIDGLGLMGSFNERLDAADTLIYIDLPYTVSYWFVTKRLLKGLLIKPEGWPDGSSVLKGTLQSYKMLKLSPKFWNNAFETRLNDMSNSKSVHIIKTTDDLNHFIERHVK